MKILVVAPTTDLPYVPKEVQTVTNLLHATLLQGDVTTRELMEALTGDFQLVWFATHGDEDGIYLTDELITPGRLIQLLRRRTKAVFLNTCSSEKVAYELFSELGIPIICTISDATDLSAYITGATLAIRLSEGYSLLEAYELSRPGFPSDYRLIGEGMVTVSNGADDGRRAYQSAQLKKLDNRLSLLTRRVDALEDKYDWQKIEFHPKLGLSNLGWWSSGALIFALMMFIVLSDFRARYHIRDDEAWILGSVLIFLSLAMMIKGLAFSFKWTNRN